MNPYRKSLMAVCLVLLSLNLNAQYMDTSFGNEGEIIYDDLKSVFAHEGNIYVRNYIESKSAKGDNKKIKVVEKYSEDGKAVNQFGENGVLVIPKGKCETDVGQGLIFKGGHFVNAFCSNDKLYYDVYDLDGNSLFQFEDPIFKLDQLIGILENETIIYGHGRTVYMAKDSENQKIEFIHAPYTENVASTISPHNKASLIRNGKIHKFHRSHYEMTNDFWHTIFDTQGNLLSAKILYSHEQIGRKEPLFHGNFDNLIVLTRQEKTSVKIPLDLDQKENNALTALKFEESGKNFVKYLTKSSSGIHYWMENTHSTAYDKFNEPYRLNHYTIYAFEESGKIHTSFGENGSYRITAAGNHGFRRLNPNEIILTWYGRINHYKLKFKISKLILE